MLHLTDVSLRSLPIPAKGQKDYFDNALPGFGIRVSQGGTRSFFLFTGKEHNRQRHSIGRFGIITLAQARAEAKRLLAEETLGHSKPKTITFSEALTIFEQQKYPALKPRTVHDYKAIFKRHYTKKLGNLRLTDIAFETVTAITDKLVKTPSEQRHALVVGNTFFRWCVRRRFLKHSPLDGVDIPKPKKRKRVLTDEELVKVYREAQATPYPFGPFAGGVQGPLQFDVERAGADTAPVHGAEHLNVTNRIEPEARRDARFDELNGSQHGRLGVIRLDKVEVAVALGLGQVWNKALVDAVRAGDDAASGSLSEHLSQSDDRYRAGSDDVGQYLSRPDRGRRYRPHRASSFRPPGRECCAYNHQTVHRPARPASDCGTARRSTRRRS
jgi:hypothetical protein